jgi:hypothetical protein
MSEEFWVLCVSVTSNDKKPKVKIFSSEDVPVKGEKLSILLTLNNKEEIECIREILGDKGVIATWKRGGVIRLR